MNHWGRCARLGILMIVAISLLGARDRGTPPPPPPTTGPQEVTVIGLLVDDRTHAPTIVLEGKRDRRAFAMAIGPAEAGGIALPLQNVTPPRPLTHDLFLTLFGRLKVTLTRVVITDLRDDIFYAIVYLNTGGPELQLDARPSDAIALAIRAKAPVLVEERVFDKASAGALPRRP